MKKNMEFQEFKAGTSSAVICRPGPDDGGEDLFCHTSSLRGCKGLGKGDKVRFEPEYDDRKAGKTGESLWNSFQIVLIAYWS